MQYVHGFNYVEHLKPQDNFGGGGGVGWCVESVILLPPSISASTKIRMGVNLLIPYSKSVTQLVPGLPKSPSCDTQESNVPEQ